MTREELDFIGAMNMCDEISNEAYKKIVCHFEGTEPCEDTVSRRAAIEIARSNIHYELDKEYEYARELLQKTMAEINSLPSVQPKAKTGKWIDRSGGDPTDPNVECSECHEWNHGRVDYCPNCGADMREVEE